MTLLPEKLIIYASIAAIMKVEPPKAEKTQKAVGEWEQDNRQETYLMESHRNDRVQERG